MAKKSKHRGAAAVRAAEPERLSLPVFIKRELARLKKAGLWDGDPDDPNLDPAVVLTQLMVDDRLAPELRAVCAKTLLPYFHDDRALMLKAELGPETGQVMVVVKSYSQPGLPAPKGKTRDHLEPDDASLKDAALMRHRGTPETEAPENPARIEARNAPGAAFYETYRDSDGVEKMRQVDGPPRAYNGTPPAVQIITEEK